MEKCESFISFGNFFFIISFIALGKNSISSTTLKYFLAHLYTISYLVIFHPSVPNTPFLYPPESIRKL